MECWYRETCGKVDSEECTPTCIRYSIMAYLMCSSGIPEKRQKRVYLIPEKADIKNYEILADIRDSIKEFVDQGKSLYLFSEFYGNGKTTWAIKLLQSYFNEIWLGNGFRCRGLFIYVPALLTRIKDSFSKRDEELDEIKDQMLLVDLVVWDDIGSAGLSNFDYSVLATYIDQRLLNGLANIYTGNLDNEGLCTVLGSRLASRVYNSSRVIKFLGGDSRGKT